jgi:hypothetical protein
MLGVECPVIDPADRESLDQATDALMRDLPTRRAKITAAVARMRAAQEVFGRFLLATYRRDSAEIERRRSELQAIFPRQPIEHQFDALYRIDNATKAGRIGFGTRIGLQVRQRLPGWRTSIDRTFRDFT